MLEFLPMLKEDRITKRLNIVLKETEDKQLGFYRSYKVIFDEIQKIYKNASVEEIIERKNYLENCMDNPYQIFSTLALALICWYVTEIISEIFNFTGINQFISNIFKILVVAIISLLIFVLISIKFTQKTRLYMKYNLRDKELKIINSTLKYKFSIT